MGTNVRTNEQATTLAVNSVLAACLPSQPAVHRSVIQLVAQNTATKAIANTTSIKVRVTRDSSKPHSDRSNSKLFDRGEPRQHSERDAERLAMDQP